jgi:hypothetical protein
MRSNPTKPATELSIDGWQATEKGLEREAGAKLELELVFELESIADAEDVSGLALITGLKKKDVDSPRISLVRIMLWASARPLQPGFTLEDAKKLVDQHTWSEIWNKILEAWISGMRKPKADEAEDFQIAQG